MTIDWHPAKQIWRASTKLGDCMRKRSLYWIRQSISIDRMAQQTTNSSAAPLLMQAMIYKSQGELDQAAKLCGEALDIFQRSFGADAPGAVAYYNALASLHILRKQLGPAQDENQKAWQLCQKYRFDENREPIAANTLHYKALIEYQQMHFDDARRDWQAALDIQLSAGQAEQAARSRNFLADIAAQRGNSADAEKLYRSALDLEGTAHAYPIEFYLTSCNLARLEHDHGTPKKQSN